MQLLWRDFIYKGKRNGKQQDKELSQQRNNIKIYLRYSLVEWNIPQTKELQFFRDRNTGSVTWGGCWLFQELQSMGGTPECWRWSQKTNCSFAVSIAWVRVGRRMNPLQNLALRINRGIETPGRRRGWDRLPRSVFWGRGGSFGTPDKGDCSEAEQCLSQCCVFVVSYWPSFCSEELPLDEQLRSPWKRQVKYSSVPVLPLKMVVLDSKQSLCVMLMLYENPLLCFDRDIFSSLAVKV